MIKWLKSTVSTKGQHEYENITQKGNSKRYVLPSNYTGCETFATAAELLQCKSIGLAAPVACAARGSVPGLGLHAWLHSNPIFLKAA